MDARLRPAFVLDALLSVDDIPVKGVLNVWLTIGGPGPVCARRVGFIVRKKYFTAGGSVQVVLAQRIWKLQVGNRRSVGVVGDQRYVVLATRGASNARF